MSFWNKHVQSNKNATDLSHTQKNTPVPPILFNPKSIYTGARYVTLDNKIKCLSLAAFIWLPTNKTVTGTAYMWELLLANHLDQSLWSTNQKYWATVRCHLLHSFLEVHCVAPLPATASCTNLVQKNQFPELNRHILTFHNKFYCLESHTEHRWRCSKEPQNYPHKTISFGNKHVQRNKKTSNLSK